MAEATPRLKIAGMTMPADTANMPSFIIALRESFIENAPLIEMIFRRCHHKVECAAHEIDRKTLAAAQGDLRSASAAVFGGEVANQLSPAVAIERAVIQERGEEINKVFGRSDLVCVDDGLQVHWRR